jgi:hypothetical protein
VLEPAAHDARPHPCATPGHGRSMVPVQRAGMGSCEPSSVSAGLDGDTGTGITVEAAQRQS